jgi:hypothetical protein
VTSKLVRLTIETRFGCSFGYQVQVVGGWFESDCMLRWHTHLVKLWEVDFRATKCNKLIRMYPKHTVIASTQIELIDLVDQLGIRALLNFVSHTTYCLAPRGLTHHDKTHDQRKSFS